MVSPESLASQIKTLEMQLAVLKAQLKRLSPTAAPKSFADLYGVFSGKVSSTEKEIDASLYHFEWEGQQVK
jgi:hypothetical protein